MCAEPFAIELTALCRGCDLSLTPAHAAALARYYDELVAWNRTTNLTAITARREVMVKHFIDSLLVARHVALASPLLDIGAGAGFPGLPLAIQHPELQVVLCESRRRRCAFLRHLIRQLRLDNCRVMEGRAETCAPVSAAIVISRACAAPREFLPLALPHLAPAGQVVCMVGHQLPDPFAPPPPLVLHQQSSYHLPDKMGTRHVLVYRDVSRETSKYSR